MSPRQAPKKHKTQAAQAAWRPGEARQVISQTNATNDRPTQTIKVTVAGASSVVVQHTLGRLPKSAWVTVGAPKVTVAGADQTSVTLSNSDPGPQTAEVALS